MKYFKHLNVYSIEEAGEFLSRYGDTACIIAGGTDLLGKLKDKILPSYPEALINIKPIPGLDQIEERGDIIEIGALATLTRS